MQRAGRFSVVAAVVLTALIAPGIAGGAESSDVADVSGHTERAVVVPLRSATPDWFTDEVQRRLDESPTLSTPGPLDAPYPGEVGIRPGTWLISPWWCTTNFVFTNGTSMAIGTAGHCVDKVGQEVTALTVAPGGSNPVLVKFGKVIARQDGGIGNDFALIQIYPQFNSWVSPTIGVIGGPCGAYTGNMVGEPVFHYGHGVGMGTGGTPRGGVSVSWTADAFNWAGTLYGGDSGSAVRVTNLQAAGDLTHGLVLAGAVPVPAFPDIGRNGQIRGVLGGGFGTRISKMLQIAKGYRLVNSPLCP